MDEYLSDEGLKNVDVLEFLGGDVFTLLELEDVLRTVNNLNCTVREDPDDIASTEPVLFIECLCILFGALVVASGDISALYLQLALRIRFICVLVVHLRDVTKAELAHFEGATDMSRDRIVNVSDRGAARCLGKAVAFKDGAAEADLQEVEHLKVNRCTTGDHAPDTTSKQVFHLLEDEVVEAAMGVGSIPIQICCLRSDTLIREGSYQASFGCQSILDLAIDTVVESGDTREDSRLQRLQIIEELEGVSMPVSNSGAYVQCVSKHALFK